MDLSLQDNQQIHSDLNKNLSISEINKDIDFLIYALKHAYSGSKKLPPGVFDDLLNKINLERKPQTTKEFGDHLGSYFSQVPDNHLSAYHLSEPKKGTDFKQPYTKPRERNSIGGNIANNSVWKIQNKKIKNKNVLILGISEFKNPGSQVWNGFEEAVIKNIKSSDIFILDLRGNGGGADAKGGWLARYLNGYNTPLASPYSEPFDMNTAESFEIMSNSVLIWPKHEGRTLELAEKQTHDFLINLSKKSRNGIKINFREEVREFRKNGSSNGNSDLNNQESDTFVFKGKIFVLIDNNCFSSGESTANMFETLKNVKFVGQNTAGSVHFGNNGYVVLPNSSIIVQMGTSFNTFKDDRFIEKIGIKPDLYIENGKNALDEVLKLIEVMH